MSVKTLEIDGRAVTGLAGETIFNVAWQNGIHIPRLCHVGGLSDAGACRMCMVEIEGQSKLAAACLRSGIDCLLTANNHSADRGAPGGS